MDADSRQDLDANSRHVGNFLVSLIDADRVMSIENKTTGKLFFLRLGTHQNIMVSITDNSAYQYIVGGRSGGIEIKSNGFLKWFFKAKTKTKTKT